MAESNTDTYHRAMDQSVLSRAMDLLLGPFRAGGYKVGQANDAVANAFARALGAQRPDPNARANANLPALERSRDVAESNYRAINDAVRGAGSGMRSGVLGALGWQDTAPAPGSPAAAALPPGALPGGWDEDMPQGFVQAPRGAPAAPAAPAVRAAMPMPRRAAPPAAPLAAAAGPTYGPYPEDDARDAEALGGGMVPPDLGASAAPALPPRQNLADEFRKRIAALGERKPGETTPEDKNRALLEASLAIMAAASRPGASALGAMGEGGLHGTATLRESDRVRRGEALDKRREDIGTLQTEFSLADKDADNVRGDVREARTERHQQALEALKARELDIMTRYREGQINDAQKALEIKAAQAAAQREIGLAKLEAAAARLGAAQDRQPPEVRLLQYLQGNPKALELYKSVKGDRSGKTTFDEGDIANMYRDALKAAATNPLAEHPGPFEQFKARLMGTGGPAKPATESEAQTQAKAAIARGASKADVNSRLQQWGYKPL